MPDANSTEQEESTEDLDWSPTAIREWDGEGCDYGENCDSECDWRIQYVDSGYTMYLFVCDDHVEDSWGYHPEDNR